MQLLFEYKNDGSDFIMTAVVAITMNLVSLWCLFV